ncbi:hypothetical protein BH09PAT2_BH09PAT2_10230 [soil metagenome]
MEKSTQEIILEKLENNIEKNENYNLFFSGLLFGLILNLLASIIDRFMQDNFHKYYNIYIICVIVLSIMVLFWLSGRLLENLGYQHGVQEYKKILKKIK